MGFGVKSVLVTLDAGVEVDKMEGCTSEVELGVLDSICSHDFVERILRL